MRSPRCQWLVLAGAALVVLTAAIPAALSKRLLPANVSGTYSIFGGQIVGENECLKTLTLDVPTTRAHVAPKWMVDFPNESISQDGTRCESGKLEVIRSMALVSERFRAAIDGLEARFPNFNSSNPALHWLAWSDSVAVGMESLRCGNVALWDNTTVMLFGNVGWGINDVAQQDLVTIEDGHPHAFIVHSGYIRCILRGPKPSAGVTAPGEDRSLPGGEGGGSGSDRGISAGPVAGTAVGAVVVGAAAAAAVAFGYRRWAAGGNGRGRGGGGGNGGGGGDVPLQGAPAWAPPLPSPQSPAAALTAPPRAPGGGPPPAAASEAPPLALGGGPFPLWYPPPPSWPVTTGMVGAPPLAPGGGPFPPWYPPPPSWPVMTGMVAVPSTRPVAAPGRPPSPPAGLLYRWEYVPPNVSDAAPPAARRQVQG